MVQVWAELGARQGRPELEPVIAQEVSSLSISRGQRFGAEEV
jgi:hypothetical protein